MSASSIGNGQGQVEAIDIIDNPAGIKAEKTPSPRDLGLGFMGINNEAYPCDCCQIDDLDTAPNTPFGDADMANHQNPHCTETDAMMQAQMMAAGNVSALPTSMRIPLIYH